MHCDVLIVGGGPAGLGAALAAGRKAERVIVIEQDSLLGGSLLWGEEDIDGSPGDVWLERAARTLQRRENVTLLTNTTASAWFDHRVVIASETVSDRRGTGTGAGPRQRLWKIHAREVIFATGAVEQPLVFANNDRPGIMLAGAVQQYCKRYAVAPGQRVVIATNNDSAYGVAGTLMNAGIDVVAMIDARQSLAGRGARELRDQGMTVFHNAVALDCRGDKGVRSVSVARRGSRETLATLQCDCVAMAGGWQPAVHLFTQARGRLRFDASLSAFVPELIPPHVHVAGMVGGALTLDGALEQGWNAGLKAAGSRSKAGRPKAGPGSGGALNIERDRNDRRSDRQWIDFQYDVTLQDIDIAVAENYTSVEHLKRYTTTGMSVDQGKTSNVNALLALAERTGRTPGEVGTTTFPAFLHAGDPGRPGRA